MKVKYKQQLSSFLFYKAKITTVLTIADPHDYFMNVRMHGSDAWIGCMDRMHGSDAWMVTMLYKVIACKFTQEGGILI